MVRTLVADDDGNEPDKPGFINITWGAGGGFQFVQGVLTHDTAGGTGNNGIQWGGQDQEPVVTATAHGEAAASAQMIAVAQFLKDGKLPAVQIYWPQQMPIPHIGETVTAAFATETFTGKVEDVQHLILNNPPTVVILINRGAS